MSEDASRGQGGGTTPENGEAQGAKAESKIEEQVRKAFADPSSHEFATEYLKEILTDWRYAQERMNRVIILLFFLIVIFELLSRASVAEVSLGPLKLHDYTLLQRLLPLAIAYVYWDLATIVTARRYYAYVANQVVRRVQESAYRNDVNLYLGPNSIALPLDYLLPNVSGKNKRIGEIVTSGSIIFLVGGLIITSVGLEVYMFYELFRLFGFKDLLNWLVLMVSFFFVSCGLWTFINYQTLIRA